MLMSSEEILQDNMPPPALTDLPALDMGSGGLFEDFRRYFIHTLGGTWHAQSRYYLYEALALTLRDRLMERWKATRMARQHSRCRRTYYLSMEYLMGRALGNTILNLGLGSAMQHTLNALGLELEAIAAQEHDAGLGNGGLGRLAACFLDSCATLALPVIGYGIRYEYGMFRQEIQNGWQIEEPDHWLRNGNPWELERPECTRRVPFGGRLEHYDSDQGQHRVRWVDTHDLLAVAYDVPIPGYRNNTVNTLRLWSADATDEFDLGEFNAGFYAESVAAKNAAQHITMILYPNDANENGKELRLKQQFFLASASLQDVIAHWVEEYGEDFSEFTDKNCFQLNDTHPSIAIVELMRLLMDEHGLDWDEAWSITTRTMAYTNHTLLPEALERWPVRLFEWLLPRPLEIIYEINRRFMKEVMSRWPDDVERLQRMSIIEEGDEKMVRMAYLAIVGSFSVNGVAALHSRLLREGLFSDFYKLWPKKFNNKTNGVTPRRWLAHCNAGLRRLLEKAIGEEWVTDLIQLSRLIPYAEDEEFRRQWREVKQDNKSRLAALIERECGVVFDPAGLFDVQVKRIHEYKRQVLNVLHIVHLYDRIRRGDTAEWTPRCVLIGGKAAPGYAMAKLIIKLINSVASVINTDPDVGDLLKVAFLPDYRVAAMEIICPGTDLSEQISTAGKEASGTSNMKFIMNGAITIGTLDGANIEIREEVGDENFFLFGLTAEEIQAARRHYDPRGIIEGDEDLARLMSLLESGHFNSDEPGAFEPLIQSMTSPHDLWLTIADFRSYIDAQKRVAAAYQDRSRWTRMSILNAAHSGKFSADRTICDYNAELWRLKPVAPLPLKQG
jgi:starch phosphorylase